MPKKRLTPKGLCVLLACACLLACAAGAAASQQAATGATLKGSAAGPDGAALAGVRVTLALAEAGSTPHTVTTDAAGEYALTNVPPGTYRLTVEAAGFKTVVDDVTLAAGDVQELKFTLEPGGAGETINIAPEVYPTPAASPAPSPSPSPAAP